MMAVSCLNLQSLALSRAYLQKLAAILVSRCQYPTAVQVRQAAFGHSQESLPPVPAAQQDSSDVTTGVIDKQLVVQSIAKPVQVG